MGLHPQAISVTMLMVLELLWRGYRVCLSTHSPHVLDVVWALPTLKKHHVDSRLVSDIFGATMTLTMQAVAYPPARGPGKVVGEGAAAVPELVRLRKTEARVI